MGPSVVEREATRDLEARFAAWLVGELETRELVAAPEGQREVFRFGAVRTVGRQFDMTWMRFVRNPGRAVAALAREAARLDRPVFVGQRRGHEVWLAVGELCPEGTADAVVLG